MDRSEGQGLSVHKDLGFPCLWPSKFSNSKVELLAKRLKKIFESLPHLGYLGPGELRDYAYYEQLIVQALFDIDTKASRGQIIPLDTKENYPKIEDIQGGWARVALYIGSFGSVPA